MNKAMKKIGFFLLIVLAMVLLLLLGIFIMSPGDVRPLIKENGNPYARGLALKEELKVNDVFQSVLIRSKDSSHPVLLYVHGGPGSPEFPFVDYMNTDLEKYFTVCYWEQRGAGMSYNSDIPVQSMSLGQFVEDTRVVSEYLLQKFGKKKIFILGHSWGTMLSAYTVKKYPELYYAYFGVGQVADQLEAEKLSYEFVMREARKRNDKKALKDLEEIGQPPYATNEEWNRSLKIERKYVTKYGGAVKEGNFMKMAVSALINCREYTLRDKFHYVKGSQQSLELMWPEVLGHNLYQEIPFLAIPVYIFQGVNDYQTNYSVAKDYFDFLEAPEKNFFTFENSAHSPNFEEIDRFEALIGIILTEYEELLSED